MNARLFGILLALISLSNAETFPWLNNDLTCRFMTPIYDSEPDILEADQYSIRMDRTEFLPHDVLIVQVDGKSPTDKYRGLFMTVHQNGEAVGEWMLSDNFVFRSCDGARNSAITERSTKEKNVMEDTLLWMAPDCSKNMEYKLKATVIKDDNTYLDGITVDLQCLNDGPSVVQMKPSSRITKPRIPTGENPPFPIGETIIIPEPEDKKSPAPEGKPEPEGMGDKNMKDEGYEDDDKWPKPEGSASKPEPEGMASEPEPEGMSSKPEPEGMASKPEPEGMASKPEPEGMSSKPEPEGKASKPEPEGMASKPEPEGMSSKPEPEGKASKPEPEGMKSKPEPESMGGKDMEDEGYEDDDKWPKPEGMVPKPEPEGMASKPEPEGMASKPEPEGMVSKPEPEGMSSKPEPEGKASKPEPEGMASKPEPEGMASKPEPEGRASKPEPEGMKSKPEPESMGGKDMKDEGYEDDDKWPRPEGMASQPEPEDKASKPEPEGIVAKPEPEGMTPKPELENTNRGIVSKPEQSPPEGKKDEDQLKTLELSKMGGDMDEEPDMPPFPWLNNKLTCRMMVPMYDSEPNILDPKAYGVRVDKTEFMPGETLTVKIEGETPADKFRGLFMTIQEDGESVGEWMLSDNFIFRRCHGVSRSALTERTTKTKKVMDDTLQWMAPDCSKDKDYKLKATVIKDDNMYLDGISVDLRCMSDQPPMSNAEESPKAVEGLLSVGEPEPVGEPMPVGEPEPEGMDDKKYEHSDDKGEGMKDGDSKPEPPAPEGMVSKPEPPAPEGMVSKPEPPAPEGMVTKPEPPAPEGMASKPETPAPEGMVSRPEPPTPEGMASKPEPPAPEGMVSKPEPPAPEGQASKPKPLRKEDGDKHMTMMSKPEPETKNYDQVDATPEPQPEGMNPKPLGLKSRKCKNPKATVPLGSTTSFEEGHSGAWGNDILSKLMWRLASGRTLSSHTGPVKAYDGNMYLYMEASRPAEMGQKAILRGPYGLKGCFCVTLMCHMLVDPQTTIELVVNGKTVRSNGFSHEGWQRMYYSVDEVEDVNIKIIATRGNTFRGDVAIDDISITPGLCREDM